MSVCVKFQLPSWSRGCLKVFGVGSRWLLCLTSTLVALSCLELSWVRVAFWQFYDPLEIWALVYESKHTHDVCNYVSIGFCWFFSEEPTLWMKQYKVPVLGSFRNWSPIFWSKLGSILLYSQPLTIFFLFWYLLQICWMCSDLTIISCSTVDLCSWLLTSFFLAALILLACMQLHLVTKL